MAEYESISITFLGTGTSTGVPVVACNCPVCLSNDKRDHRLRTSAMVETGHHRFIIDCGPDFRYQMIREKIDDISAILFTHGHRDHIAGLDDVRAFNYVLNKTVDVYASQEVVDSINKEFPYILHEKRFFGSPQLKFHIIDNSPFEVENITIQPIEVMHNQMHVFGFRIGDFSYITDASSIPEAGKAKLKGTRVLVINALRKSKHISHFSLSEALEQISDICPERAYITHLSHFMGLHENIEADLPGNVFLAYDGLKVSI